MFTKLNRMNIGNGGNRAGMAEATPEGGYPPVTVVASPLTTQPPLRIKDKAGTE